MSQLRNILFLIVVGAFVSSCHWKQPIMIHTYTDQNNNRYYISNTDVKYVPIKASESSSGTYDGGDPATILITEAQFAEITSLAEAVFSATNSHTTKRQMMTSILSTTVNGESKRVTLTRSAERTALEKFLTALRD